MKKQIQLYSVKLGMVKTERERQLFKMKYINESTLYKIKDSISKRVKQELDVKDWNENCAKLFSKYLKESADYKIVEEAKKDTNKILHNLMLEYEGTRTIDSKFFRQSNIIATSENVLTRTLDLSNLDETTLDFIVIEAKKQDRILLEQVIKRGLEIDNEKYIFFTAGAGQTRQEKFLMIKEELWISKEKTLMCGLTLDRINTNAPMNVAKFLAYLALNNSASDIIEKFDVEKCIIVDDFETMVNGEVDYITRNDKVDNGVTVYTKGDKEITRKLYKTEWGVEPKTMDVPVPHMDGCGICLTTFSKKNQQVRLPFIKGLLTPTNFKLYSKEQANENYKVKDIWGKTWDIIDDKIEIIFTKSQFKLWKNYENIYVNGTDEVFMTGWDVYKACFKAYGCTANLCKEDESKYKDMTINYQMLQTLTDMTDEQIEILTKDVKETINEVHYDPKAQLNFLKATKENQKRDYLQEILRIYPEMLTSAYVKKQVSDAITSEKNKAMSGKIKLNAKRTFIIPDVVAFMDWLFNGTEKPMGALEGQEVYCKLYKEDSRLGVLRSPHLSREWAIRTNAISTRNNDLFKYFASNGIYTSSHDLISKMLTFDNDGDEALVISDKEKRLLDLAEEQMKDIRSLYYEMGKADAQVINTDNIYKSLKFAYKSNIGKVSNCITNIWNDDYADNSDNIKKLCAYNNFVIDSAKTLEVPKIPKELKDLMSVKKHPYFFQFAKNKEEKECLAMGEGIIDRICKSIDKIPYTNFKYGKNFGTFRTAKLMNNSKIEIDLNVINMYLKLEEKTRKLIAEYATKAKNDEEINNTNYKQRAYEEARKDVLDYAKELDINYSDIIDMIIKWSFKKNELTLAFVFEVFGAVIINNINKNVPKSIDTKHILCADCGTRVHNTNGKVKRCTKCASEKKYYRICENVM